MREYATIALILTAPLLSGCSGGPEPDPQPEPAVLRGDPKGLNYPLHQSAPDTRPAMQLDSSKPYRLEFGRGSGWHGLDTIALDETGQVQLHRLHGGGYWEKAVLTVDSSACQRIAKAIHDLGMLRMDRYYSADIVDGTQWVFWLTQGEGEKSIYFSNHFPEAIQDFAVAIDEELKEAGLDRVKWTDVPEQEARQHEEAIWSSIRNKRSNTSSVGK